MPIAGIANLRWPMTALMKVLSYGQKLVTA
jgi:hypothetical protein